MEDIIIWVVEWVKSMGYLGVFLMTMIESTFIPIPAELTMIPAGYLVQQGEMNGFMVMLCAICGTITGALVNYAIAYHFGRRLILKYGRYFFMPEHKLAKMEHYFEEYGSISTFIGRLLPGVRHYISFPAGLARMRLNLFTLYTALGGALWLLVLFAFGYYIGENEALIKQYIIYIKIGILLCIIGTGLWYWKRQRKKRALAALLALQQATHPIDGDMPEAPLESDGPDEEEAA